MALTAFDFTKGVDFSALASATGSDHNNLIDAGTPRSDSATEGKGLNIWTVDSALDTPIVPDAAGTTKWKRYTWIRVPFAGAASKTPTLYGWNEDAASDATLLKWLPITADLSTIESDIATLQSDLITAAAVAAEALTTAGQAYTAANNALNIANAAQTDATTALALAQEPPAAGSITAAMLASSLDLSDKTINYPNESVQAEDLANILDLSSKTITFPTVSLTNTVVGILNSRKYTSAPTTLITGVIADTAHGFSVTPTKVWAMLICTDAAGNIGYAQNDTVAASQIMTSGTAEVAFAFGANASNVYMLCHDIGALQTLNKSTGAVANMDNTKWKAIIYAEL